jgi:hypothetical protein
MVSASVVGMPCVPVIGRQRLAMAEDHGLSTAPVLVIDLDVFGIFLTGSNVWHRHSPYSTKFEIVPAFDRWWQVALAARGVIVASFLSVNLQRVYRTFVSSKFHDR